MRHVKITCATNSELVALCALLGTGSSAWPLACHAALIAARRVRGQRACRNCDEVHRVGHNNNNTTVRALTDLTVDVVGDGAKGDNESSRRVK